MTSQAIAQLVVFVAAIIAAGGTFAAHYFGEQDKKRQRKETEAAQAANAALLAKISQNTEVLLKAANVKPDVWTEVEMVNVPPGVADYLLLLFVSNKGRISGKVRIKGSESTSWFSTTANARIPVAVPNLWVPEQKQYKVPTILEFSITEKTSPDAGLSILTTGWVDTRGQEPH
jgi:hypothetical protein